MQRIPDTDLILTPSNRVYHLDLHERDIAGDVILVGDPGRVARISALFSEVHYQGSHREFITHTGTYNGRRITVISSGIGTDNIDIVLNELDAAVNVDPETRIPRERQRSLHIYRLGTCGTVQEDIAGGELIVSTHGLGLDCLLNYYSGIERVSEMELSDAFVAWSGWSSRMAYPYAVAASPALLAKFSGMTQGITATAPGFYAPQGRNIRIRPAIDDLPAMLGGFSYKGLRILNFEMETSALYGLGRLLGHECITVCAAIANRRTGTFAGDYQAGIDNMIKTCLDKITI